VRATRRNQSYTFIIYDDGDDDDDDLEIAKVVRNMLPEKYNMLKMLKNSYVVTINFPSISTQHNEIINTNFKNKKLDLYLTHVLCRNF
jgi:hypothetical protein